MTGEGTKNRWKWVLGIAAVLFAALVGASYLVCDLLQSGRMHPLILLILAAVISIAIPMIRTNFFPSNKDCEAEYTFHEQRLEKEITDHISASLGQDAYGRVFSPAGPFRDSADDAIKKMLAKNDFNKNPDLHFTLLVTLARYYEKSGDPQAGIQALETALEIKPQHFIARMHLAGNYEWIGAGEEAGREYRKLLEHPEVLSRAMKKLVAAKHKATMTT